MIVVKWQSHTFYSTIRAEYKNTYNFDALDLHAFHCLRVTFEWHQLIRVILHSHENYSYSVVYLLNSKYACQLSGIIFVWTANNQPNGSRSIAGTVNWILLLIGVIVFIVSTTLQQQCEVLDHWNWMQLITHIDLSWFHSIQSNHLLNVSFFLCISWNYSLIFNFNVFIRFSHNLVAGFFTSEKLV